MVNGKKIRMLRDTGSSVNVVKKSLVNPNEFTGRMIPLQLINGYKQEYPEATIEVESPYFNGHLTACVMQKPVFDLILGNTKDIINEKAAPSKSRRTGKEWSNPDPNQGGTSKALQRRRPPEERIESMIEGEANAVTRHMAKATTRPTKPLKVRSVVDIFNQPDLSSLQLDDITLKSSFDHAKSCKTFNHKDGSSSSFVLKDTKLYRETKNGRKGHCQLVVPNCYRRIIFDLAHHSVMGAHLGKAKTKARVSEDFYWPSMGSQIWRWTASCKICQQTCDKGRVKPQPLVPLPVIEEPFSRVAIDIVGEIRPASSSGHKYILTVVDHATRWAEAVPLKNIDTSTVAEALLSIFSRVGLPKQVLSDNGSQFTGHMMKEVYRILGIQGLYTSVYHPQANGACERFNGTLKKMLRRMASEQPKCWDRYINPLLFAYREAPHSSTGFSPFMLVYGRDVRSPLHILRDALEGRISSDSEVISSYEYVMNLQERLRDTLKLAREELAKSQINNAKYFNVKAKSRQFRIGDQCLLLLPTHSNKLLAKWQGPFEIVKPLSKVNYLVHINGENKVYHANMIKLFLAEENQAKVIACIKSDRMYSDSTLMPDLSVCRKERDDLLNLVTLSQGRPTCQTAAAIVDGQEETGQINVLPNQAMETYENIILGTNLLSDERIALRELSKEYSSLFTDVPIPAKIKPHHITLRDEHPSRSRAYPIPFHLRTAVVEEIREMEKSGYLEPSSSPYSSPMVIVKKPNNSLRICGDFRQVNQHIEFDSEPMADQNSIFANLAHSKYFSKMDLTKGFYQLPLEASSRPITALATPIGLKQFTVLPFGLSISPAVFNKTIRRILDGISNLEIFMDDLLVHTATWEEHLETLRIIFERFRKYAISIKPSKCEFGLKQVNFLGHIVGEGILRMQHDKTEKIRDAQPPSTKKQVRSFLGLVNYYSAFIRDFSKLSKPLHDLTRKSQPNRVIWEPVHQDSFEKLKIALCKEPILALPDFQLPFLLKTDASATGIGAVLFQEFTEGERPIAYWSRKLKQAEINYATIERELLAIVEGVKKFHTYLYGAPFILETDHLPLTYLKGANNRNGRLTRWSLFLQDYPFNVRYVKGSKNVHADYLSRQ